MGKTTISGWGTRGLRLQQRGACGNTGSQVCAFFVQNNQNPSEFRTINFQDQICGSGDTVDKSTTTKLSSTDQDFEVTHWEASGHDGRS